ncbi:hypothetical protein GWK08_18270 [Leptobacterium flavescens]|uniref:Uncharacterized protein n=1 Tax=Leptobacterium flavescens TaxID=472055 RepID=A0A6P0UY82_9FLAO|nr:hypothetical protein [Leptobacterium flavescens]NER15406.1 hypothetical protein [Leptobacterium flavescens]
MKKLLRRDYIADVQRKLAVAGVTSRKGTPYSDKMISHVFNGRYQNPRIEKAILDVYLERKKAAEKDLKYKNKVLGIGTED